jgi:hypothetical protein
MNRFGQLWTLRVGVGLTLGYQRISNAAALQRKSRLTEVKMLTSFSDLLSCDENTKRAAG